MGPGALEVGTGISVGLPFRVLYFDKRRNYLVVSMMGLWRLTCSSVHFKEVKTEAKGGCATCHLENQCIFLGLMHFIKIKLMLNFRVIFLIYHHLQKFNFSLAFCILFY